MSDKKGSKLHEVLAVEGELEGVNKATLQEATHTFKAKADHFLGHVKSYQAFNDDDADRLAPENKETVTSVSDKLGYVFGHISRYLDAVYQKERTNQTAKADIVLQDGTVLATDVPATFLLGLETKIRQWREMLMEIPTLAPGIAWKKDESRGKGTYVTEHPVETRRTKKTVQHKILVEATQHHPAQIEKWNEDVAIGKFITTTWCTMFSPAEKSAVLARVDELARAVKQARQRANCAEVVKGNIGETLAKFILGAQA
jgi:hypothetical protein